MISFIFIIQGLILAMHGVIYKSLSAFVLESSKQRIIIGSLLFILSLVFLISSALIRTYANPLLSFFYKMSVIWISIASYLFFAAVISSIVFLFAGFIVPAESFSIARITTASLMTLAILVQCYGLIHAKDIQIARYAVPIQNLPTYWENKKIVFFADNHMGAIHNAKDIDNLRKMVEKENPEMILIAGDLYDGPKVDTLPITDALKEFRAQQGVYFVGGNHEEYGDTEGFLSSIKTADITVLNDAKAMREGLEIVGLAYATTQNHDSTKTVLNQLNIDPNMPTVLIKHVPKDLQPIADAGIDIAVFGHTHNGQQFPWNLVAKSVYDGYHHGSKLFGSTTMITTSGFGSWGPPQRIGTDSEFVVVTLRKK